VSTRGFEPGRRFFENLLVENGGDVGRERGLLRHGLRLVGDDPAFENDHLDVFDRVKSVSGSPSIAMKSPSIPVASVPNLSKPKSAAPCSVADARACCGDMPCSTSLTISAITPVFPGGYELSEPAAIVTPCCSASEKLASCFAASCVAL